MAATTTYAQTSLSDSLQTHPTTAAQAKAFTAPTSLSYPGGTGEMTPPSEKDGLAHGGQANGVNGTVNGQVIKQGDMASGSGAAPTPAATPQAVSNGPTGVSGIVPTLQ